MMYLSILLIKVLISYKKKGYIIKRKDYYVIIFRNLINDIDKLKVHSKKLINYIYVNVNGKGKKMCKM